MLWGEGGRNTEGFRLSFRSHDVSRKNMLKRCVGLAVQPPDGGRCGRSVIFGNKRTHQDTGKGQ